LEVRLKATVREDCGKGSARKARRSGNVPAVLYGRGLESKPLIVREDEVREVLRGSAGINVLIDLEVKEGRSKENHLVMIKEIQKDILKDFLLHIDFLKVSKDEKVTMKVPIALKGEEESVGLKAGGTLQHNLWEVEVSCLPEEVPDHVIGDITALPVGGHLTVSDLKTPDGVTILSDPDDVVLTILAPRITVEAAPAAEVPTEEAEVEAAREIGPSTGEGD